MASSEKRDFDSASKTWDENPGRVKVAACIAESIINKVSISPAMDAIDYGCGTGLVTLALQPYVKSMTGIDSSSGMLEILKAKALERKLTNIRTLKIDLENDPIPDIQADLLVCSMTMHHVSDVNQVFAAFNKMLKNDGYIAIADLDSDEGEFHEDNTGVVHPGFDRDAIRNILESVGFEDVEASTACVVPREVAGKGIREFTIFLITARKP